MSQGWLNSTRQQREPPASGTLSPSQLPVWRPRPAWAKSEEHEDEEGSAMEVVVDESLRGKKRAHAQETKDKESEDVVPMDLGDEDGNDNGNEGESDGKVSGFEEEGKEHKKRRHVECNGEQSQGEGGQKRKQGGDKDKSPQRLLKKMNAAQKREVSTAPRPFFPRQPAQTAPWHDHVHRRPTPPTITTTTGAVPSHQEKRPAPVPKVAPRTTTVNVPRVQVPPTLATKPTNVTLMSFSGGPYKRWLHVEGKELQTMVENQRELWESNPGSDSLSGELKIEYKYEYTDESFAAEGHRGPWKRLWRVTPAMQWGGIEWLGDSIDVGVEFIPRLKLSTDAACAEIGHGSFKSGRFDLFENHCIMPCTYKLIKRLTEEGHMEEQDIMKEMENKHIKFIKSLFRAFLLPIINLLLWLWAVIKAGATAACNLDFTSACDWLKSLPRSVGHTAATLAKEGLIKAGEITTTLWARLLAPLIDRLHHAIGFVACRLVEGAQHLSGVVIQSAAIFFDGVIAPIRDGLWALPGGVAAVLVTVVTAVLAWAGWILARIKALAANGLVYVGKFLRALPVVVFYRVIYFLDGACDWTWWVTTTILAGISKSLASISKGLAITHTALHEFRFKLARFIDYPELPYKPWMETVFVIVRIASGWHVPLIVKVLLGDNKTPTQYRNCAGKMLNYTLWFWGVVPVVLMVYWGYMSPVNVLIYGGVHLLLAVSWKEYLCVIQ